MTSNEWKWTPGREEHLQEIEAGKLYDAPWLRYQLRAALAELERRHDAAALCAAIYQIIGTEWDASGDDPRWLPVMDLLGLAGNGEPLGCDPIEKLLPWTSATPPAPAPVAAEQCPVRNSRGDRCGLMHHNDSIECVFPPDPPCRFCGAPVPKPFRLYCCGEHQEQGNAFDMAACGFSTGDEPHPAEPAPAPEPPASTIDQLEQLKTAQFDRVYGGVNPAAYGAAEPTDRGPIKLPVRVAHVPTHHGNETVTVLLDATGHETPDGEAALQQIAAALNAQQPIDTQRLDWLEAQASGYGRGWIARDSENGRGFRLHETSRKGAQPTVREAIDAVRAALNTQGGTK